MKLQDKETNEIIEIEIRQVNDKNLEDRTLTTINGEGITLEALSKKFCDYVEPIEFWTIDTTRTKAVHILENPRFRYYSDEQIANLEELGLKFETEEEAEQAIEEMKALTRLKNNGFEFVGCREYENLCGNGFEIPIMAVMPPESYTDTETVKDLELLFGGEEDE